MMVGTVKAKSSIVLVGWKDPLVYQLERAAPTPTQEAIMVTLQWLASAKVCGKVTDMTTHLVSHARRPAKNKLAKTLPQRVTHPSVGPGRCCWSKQKFMDLCQDRASYE